MGRQEDLAWAAGLFEGEGSTVLRNARNRKIICLQLSLTDEDVINKFFKVMTVGKLYGPYLHKSDLKRKSVKPHWMWQTTKWWEAQQCIAYMWSYLGSRRRERAKNLLQIYLQQLEPQSSWSESYKNTKAYKMFGKRHKDFSSKERSQYVSALKEGVISV